MELFCDVVNVLQFQLSQFLMRDLFTVYLILCNFILPSNFFLVTS